MARIRWTDASAVVEAVGVGANNAVLPDTAAVERDRPGGPVADGGVEGAAGPRAAAG